jgi:zinc protease
MKKLTSIRLWLLYAVIVIAISACSTKKDNDKLSIPYEKYTLPNGLQVILHVDNSDPVISYAVMYHVGSSREEKQKTGFAHLYEHLLFQGSENVPPGMFDKITEGVGGMNNGFTSRDVTTYFEIFPKNALEKILWLESDRMGFFINSVTQRALAIQQNVVQNEKRQYVDNSPYGFTDYVINNNLYPEDHPYNWEVIGEMDDLKNATLGDARSFYEKYYGPNNATLVLGGDFVIDSVKPLIEKYFGEIKSHGDVVSRPARVPKPEKTIKLFHEDNFANVPELTMVWPVPEAYNKDAYALDFLAKILAGGKKAPMYKILVKGKQLTSKVSAYNRPDELAGEFTLNIRANEGKNLKEIESAVFEAFQKFETEGITERDIERVKAGTEKDFYQGLSSVFYKSLQLAFYNTFRNDPGYIQKDIENIKAVTLADVQRVYNTYIKGRPYVATSFVPKGKPEMKAEPSILADVKEESIENATQVAIADASEDSIVKTPSVLKRNLEPFLTKDPDVNVPLIWKSKLANGIEVYGIEQNELPLVNVNVVFEGGIYQDAINLPGIANLVADVMPQGTKNKTPEELEEEIKLLGANIDMYTTKEEIVMSADMLSRNFEKTFSLMEEILLEPRWDVEEFRLAQTSTLNSILQSEVQPRDVAKKNFYKLLYGDKHIFGYNGKGTKESVNKIAVDDLKRYYQNNFSPAVTKIHIVGNISKERALAALKPLESRWAKREVKRNDYPLPPAIDKSQVFFVDIPGSKQSVIYIGYLALSRDNPDFIKANFVNYRLGGSFTSIINQILREEKGFTYGAFSYFGEQKVVAPFTVSTSVRSDATFESLMIVKENMEKYRDGISANDLQFTKDYLVKSNALRFETLGSLAEMLSTMSKYGFSDDYIEKEAEIVKNMTLEEHKNAAMKYIVPDGMVYLVVGDAATQMKPLEKIGFGKPVLTQIAQ